MVRLKIWNGRTYRVEILTTNSSIQNMFWSFSKILLAGTSSGLFPHILLPFASVVDKKVIGEAKTFNPLERSLVLNWLSYLGRWRYWNNKLIFEPQTGDVACKSKVFEQKSHWSVARTCNPLVWQNSSAKLTELPWQLKILKQ